MLFIIKFTMFKNIIIQFKKFELHNYGVLYRAYCANCELGVVSSRPNWQLARDSR